MRGTRIRAYVHTYKGDARSNYLCDNDLDLEFRLSCSLFLSSPFSLVFPLPWEYIENKWTMQIRIIFFRCNNKVIKRKTYTHTYTQRDDTWSHHSRTRIRTSGRVVNRPFSHERISLFSSRFVTHSMFLHFFLSLSHSLSLSLYFLLRYRFPFVALTHGIHTVNVEIKRKGTNKRTNRQAV